MDKEKWIKVGLEIMGHLEEIRRIVARNGMELISMGVFSDGLITATYIDDDETQWSVVRRGNGVVVLEENQDVYYTRS